MKNITFKHEKYSARKLTSNVLAVYALTSNEQRKDWYYEAHKWAVNIMFAANLESTPENLNKACGVIAALSPVKSWNDNKKIALDFLLTGNAGHMKQFVNKAAQIVASNGSEQEIKRILNGNKITAFYHNIRWPQCASTSTIDRHALRVLLMKNVNDDDYRGITDNQYQFFVDAYKRAAKKIGITPARVQSATWEFIRTNKHILTN